MPTPLSMRLPDDDVAIIDRAANLRGRSRTQFIRDAAVRAAEETLLQSALIRMSPKAFDNFERAVSAPAKAVPEMVELIRRPAPWHNP